MKKTKGFLMVLLSAVLAFCGFACNNGENGGGGKTEVGKIVLPEWSNDKAITISGWDSPINTLADYQLAKDMGLTHMFIDQFFARRGTAGYGEILGFCEQVGLKAIVNIGSYERHENTQEDNTDYSQFPAVDMINYWDEPWHSSFPRLEELAVEHTQKYGADIAFYVNLYPNTATSTFGGKGFNGYVGDLADNVLSKVQGRKIISCDIYPFLKGRLGGHQMRSTWLAGVETVSTHAKRIGGESQFFLQATEHTTPDSNYRAMSEEDLRFQFFVLMAFGVKGFHYFTYRTSFIADFKKSCVDDKISGKTYPLYNYAKTVNTEIQAFDRVYMNFDWNGTMPVLGELGDGYNLNFDGLNNAKEKIDALKSITAEQDALVGQFKDDKDRDGLIVTNFTDPADGLLNYVTLEFEDASKILMWRKGMRYLYEIKNNKFDIQLDSGEGVFIVPIK